MDKLTTFNYKEFPVRTIQNETGVWWVLADVCAVLDISKYRDAATRLDDDERGSVKVDTPGGMQDMTAINEPGLYNLIFRSNKPEAKNFKRWVTHEVLPAIRKNGSYGGQDDKREIAQMIIACKSAAAVKGILALYGVPAHTHQLIPPPSESPADSVTEYLKTVERWELTSMDTKHVYQDYVSFCRGNHIQAFKLPTFSKAIHKQTGLIVRRQRIDGKPMAFYT